MALLPAGAQALLWLAGMKLWKSKQIKVSLEVLLGVTLQLMRWDWRLNAPTACPTAVFSVRPSLPKSAMDPLAT